MSMMRNITRREYVGLTAGLLAAGAGSSVAGLPNILWVMSEDNQPFLGRYGSRLARTPALDRMAAEGVLYEN